MKKDEIKIGLSVMYYSVITSDGTKHCGRKTVIVSEPWNLYGEWVCKIEGMSACVSIKHLELSI